MFLRFSKENVKDLLLPEISVVPFIWYLRSLDEVEDRNAISNRTQDRVAVGGEQDISLPVNSAADVIELEQIEQPELNE